jgi:FAD/FMN-containing dehydrogenase
MVRDVSSSLIADLLSVLGPDGTVTDPDLMVSYEQDWTGRWRGRAAAVIRPADATQVAAALRICARHRVPVVPQGGNTCLVGGAVPAEAAEGAVVLSLRRMRRIEPVDLVAGQVVAAAGVTVAELRAHVNGHARDIGVDLGSRDTATVGGIAATNAGGERVLRHGVTRHQVTGIEAVLPDGRLISRLSGLVKDNVGYDLPALLVGSEGTLAVITKVQLRLVGLPARRVTALVEISDIDAAVGLVARLRDDLPSLDAVELIFGAGIDLVCAHQGLPRPLPPRPDLPAGGPYLLLECVGPDDPTDELAGALMVGDGVGEIAVGRQPAERDRLWSYREGHTTAVNALGVPLKLDVAVPPRAFPAFIDELRRIVAAAGPELRTDLWGHLAEANLHVNITGFGGDDVKARRDGVTGSVLRLVTDLGGSIGAEHGVGRAKMPWLGLSRSADELSAVAAVKHALDPEGLLNPGVLVAPYGIGAV